jgi:hypothetical protein
VGVSLPVVGDLGAGRAPVRPHRVRREPSMAGLSARAKSLPMNDWPIVDVGEREERTAAVAARWLARCGHGLGEGMMATGDLGGEGRGRDDVGLD